MGTEKIILTNLRIPAKGNMQFYANYTLDDEQKADVLANNPMKNRKVHINCPPNMDLFTHMKICLLGYLDDKEDSYEELISRVLKSDEERIQFGSYFMAEIGNFTAVVNNVEKIIYLEKI